MFCTACGAKNADDARFCNMCGDKIVPVGSPGGAAPRQPTQLGVAVRPRADAPSRPAELTGSMGSAMSNTGSISLDAIGVRTSKKTWTFLAASALGLLLVGALGSYAYMKLEAKTHGAAAPEDPFTLGAPSVAIEKLPPAPTPAGSTPEARAPVAPTSPPQGTTSIASATTHTGRSGHEIREPRGTSMSTATSVAAHATTMTETAMTEAAMAETSMAETARTETATSMTETPAGNGTEADATGTDRDLEMELYSGRVRYLVRRYYVASAQRCFEHATTNNPSLHGQVIVAIQIGANGYVSSADVARNSTGDDTLGACLAGQARTWRLSPPPGGEPIQMNMPFSR